MQPEEAGGIGERLRLVSWDRQARTYCWRGSRWARLPRSPRGLRSCAPDPRVRSRSQGRNSQGQRRSERCSTLAQHRLPPRPGSSRPRATCRAQRGSQAFRIRDAKRVRAPAEGQPRRRRRRRPGRCRAPSVPDPRRRPARKKSPVEVDGVIERNASDARALAFTLSDPHSRTKRQTGASGPRDTPRCWAHDIGVEAQRALRAGPRSPASGQREHEGLRVHADVRGFADAETNPGHEDKDGVGARRAGVVADIGFLAADHARGARRPWRRRAAGRRRPGARDAPPRICGPPRNPALSGWIAQAGLDQRIR